jgi:cysteine desulfurase
VTTPIYLDHNATTPVDPAVLDAMLPFFQEHFGNPASVEHWHGHNAQAAVERARTQVAETIGARADDVVFTGSCTEANNIAILGAAAGYPSKRHLVTTAVEHPAVMEPCRSLARNGYDLTILPVDEFGQVNPDAVRKSIRDDTLLVSVMTANNEVGSLQPVAEIGAVCEQAGTLFHTDMAQATAYMSLDVRTIGAHLVSLSAHKAYGPKGVGALYIRGRRPRVRLQPIVLGGGQERGLRSGTVATPLVVGMGAAFEIVRRGRAADAKRIGRQTTQLFTELQKRVRGVELNGHPVERLPNNLSLLIDAVEPLALMRLLRDQISFSASSACATDRIHTSHVLLAMFGDTVRARSAFRLAPGRYTTDDELDKVVSMLVTAIEQLRQLAA